MLSNLNLKVGNCEVNFMCAEAMRRRSPPKGTVFKSKKKKR